VDFSYYPTLPDARAGLMRDKGVTRIIGVEIVEGAVPIEDHPFDGRALGVPPLNTIVHTRTLFAS
jgi:hypothetical protein